SSRSWRSGVSATRSTRSPTTPSSSSPPRSATTSDPIVDLLVHLEGDGAVPLAWVVAHAPDGPSTILTPCAPRSRPGREPSVACRRRRSRLRWPALSAAIEGRVQPFDQLRVLRAEVPRAARRTECQNSRGKAFVTGARFALPVVPLVLRNATRARRT